MIGRETMRTGLGGAIGKKQVEFFRNRLKAVGVPAAHFVAFARSSKVRVLVPLRLNVTRRMANLDLLEERLRKDAKVEMEWQTVDFAAENPEQQVWIAQNSDIIFSAHGMALSYGIFLPRHGEIVEVLVKESFFCPRPIDVNANPWTLYGGLMRLSGISHRCCQGEEMREKTTYANGPHEWAKIEEIDVDSPQVAVTLMSIHDVAERKRSGVR